jgi:hypothetical protein
MINTQITATNADAVLSQLAATDRKVRNRTVRRATNASGKVVLAQVRQLAEARKITGYTKRSLKSVSKSKSGETTVRVGQEKQRQFKLKKSTRIRNKNLSQIQRAGKPVPIHWLERGTKPHTITAAGKGNSKTYSAGSNVLAFRVGGRKGVVFARTVKNPGMQAGRILERSVKISQGKAAVAFLNVVKEDLRNVGS